MYSIRHGVLVRKELFGFLVLLGDGRRYQLGHRHGAMLESIAATGTSTCDLADNERDALVAQLLSLGIIERASDVARAGRFVANPPISSDCLSFPRTVYLEVTGRCNLACLHCYSSSGAHVRSELPFSVTQRLVDELTAKGAEFLSIGGGEPLLYRHLFDLLQHCQRADLAVELTTNGTLLTPHNVLRLVQAGLRHIQVSLDGASAETYERLRPGGSFALVLRNLARLSRHFVVSVCTVATAANVEQIGAIIDLAKGCGAKHYRVLPLMHIGRAENVDIAPSPVQMRALNRYLLDRQRVEREIHIQFNENLVTPDRKNIEWMPRDHYGCSAARSTCAIDFNGDVFPCSYMRSPALRAGNIALASLASIWSQSGVFQQLRALDHVDGACGECRHLSTCRGGCRAAAYLQHGNIAAADPLCTVAP